MMYIYLEPAESDTNVVDMNEDIIYRIQEYVRKRGHSDIFETNRPIQRPFSMWAVDELIYELQNCYDRFPDEVFRNYISLMRTYEEYAEVERKTLYRIARETAAEIYSYVFEDVVDVY